MDKIIQIDGEKILTESGRVFERFPSMNTGADYYWIEIQPPEQIMEDIVSGQADYMPIFNNDFDKKKGNI